MKFSILTTLTAIIGSTAAANQAVVINNCPGTIYVQSYPYNGGAPGPLYTLKSGQKFSENMRSSGSVRLPVSFPFSLIQPCFDIATNHGSSYLDCQDCYHQDPYQASVLWLLLYLQAKLCLL
jgi:hypothetical protein